MTPSPHFRISLTRLLTCLFRRYRQAPTLQWKEVVYHLDHPGFQVKDRTALRLITQALQLGLQLQGLGADAFPVQVLYRVWKNADSQVSGGLEAVVAASERSGCRAAVCGYARLPVGLLCKETALNK